MKTYCVIDVSGMREPSVERIRAMIDSGDFGDSIEVDHDNLRTFGATNPQQAVEDYVKA